MAIALRRCQYKGEDGFLVCGKRTPQDTWGVSIWTRTRASAEHIKAKVKRGERVNLEDFRYGEPARTVS